ncbi:MAG TPA: UDP-3-O-acyl-N-acetylglucosamine deacetylase, partial [Desulfomonilaceae bacterium]|nr:UDP-3-O-acyl-N-acetylglucosamine deacetylase [Desulfomonilaceae bacterium]
MNKGRILIVDDQEEILDSLGAILADEGHEVLRARDGQDALHVVQSDSPDMVFLDIWIPGIDGMQTLKAIKRINPDCSVVMMSGHGTIETAVKAIKLGATDYLEKPLNLEDVLHLVHKAVADRQSEKRSHEGNGSSPGMFIGTSAKTEALRRALENAAIERGSVWLSGESGTGKEFIARTIHFLEGKDRNNLVKVPCPELTEANIEEVFFGKRKASNGKSSGKLAQAAGGTLLLVRVDRLERRLKIRLAEILRDCVDRHGSTDHVNGSRFRIVSTSVADPETLVREENIPEELADILAQRVIRIPTLRERAQDIPLFVEYFLKEASVEFEREITGADDQAMSRLLAYSWPGNVKELKILMEHVVMTAPGPRITVNDLLIPSEQGIEMPPTMRDSTGEPTSADLRRETGAAHPVPVGPMITEPLRQQKTLRGSVVVYGQGLHTGEKTGLTLSPLPPFSGIVFGHITTDETVLAVLDNVASTGFSTCLKGNGTLAKTIEHLMAVFHVYGLTNVMVKISGEVPVMDGSALEFCKLVEGAEIIPQDEPIEEIVITEPIDLPMGQNGSKHLRVEPSDALEVEYYLDYPPPIGTMHMVFKCNSPEDFKEQIAPARTFGFVKDMRMMDEMGLAGG